MAKNIVAGGLTVCHFLFVIFKLDGGLNACLKHAS